MILFLQSVNPSFEYIQTLVIIADSIQHNPGQPNSFILPPQTNNITVILTFAAWCNKENIYLEYQLNDTLHWQPVNTDLDAVIHLNNLSPGNYLLRFRKLNGFGINNYSYKTIRFSITTPWYKTWWFDILIVLAAGGLLLLYVNLRTRQLKLNQQWLEKQVSEKTKELLGFKAKIDLEEGVLKTAEWMKNNM